MVLCRIAVWVGFAREGALIQIMDGMSWNMRSGWYQLEHTVWPYFTKGVDLNP